MKSRKSVLTLGLLVALLMIGCFCWMGMNHDTAIIEGESLTVAEQDLVVEDGMEATQEETVTQEKKEEVVEAPIEIPKEKETNPTSVEQKPVVQKKSSPAVTQQKQQEVKSASPEKKDKYLTDPLSEGKPEPTEWQEVTIDKEKGMKCTLSVSCATILDNMENLDPAKVDLVPADGTIYRKKTVTFYEGESVFVVLLREMKNNKIHMEFEMTPIYNSNYIEGIQNLYEFDCGELSGWMYKVNGGFPNYGCSRYILEDGDDIEWVYTCDLGRDVGGDEATGGGQR